jgi:hypothetical protein
MMSRLEPRFKGMVLGEPPGLTPLAVLHPRAFAPVGQNRRGFAVRGLRSRQSHAQYILADVIVPELREYHEEVARFFDQHLGR